jgi:hypothetical protein
MKSYELYQKTHIMPSFFMAFIFITNINESKEHYFLQEIFQLVKHSKKVILTAYFVLNN